MAVNGAEILILIKGPYRPVSGLCTEFMRNLTADHSTFHSKRDIMKVSKKNKNTNCKT